MTNGEENGARRLDALIDKAPEQDPEPAPAPAAETAKTAEPPAEEAPAEPEKDAFHDDPLIKKAIEMFKGKLTQ